MINIVSTFYVSKYNSHLDNERTNELTTALIKNLESEFIEKVHLFVDDEESLIKLNDIDTKIHNNKINMLIEIIIRKHF